MKFLFAYAMCVVWDMGMTRFWRPDWLVFVAIDVAICVVIGLCVASKPAPNSIVRCANYRLHSTE